MYWRGLLSRLVATPQRPTSGAGLEAVALSPKATPVTGFRVHFLEKYFAYRRRYVEYMLGEAPRRGVLANLSEVVRLAFVATGSALIAAILWVLAVPALGRAPFWGLVFVLLALAATAAAGGALAGVVAALRDRGRVEERAAAAANAEAR